MLTKSPLLLRCCLGALAAVLLAACGDDEAPVQTPTAVPVRAPLSVVQPSQVDVVLHAVGTVEPMARTTPATRVAGRVTAIQVDRGARVESGQLLVRIDSRDLQQGLERARADRDQAAAAARQAQADFERAESLFGEDAIAPQTYDRARTARDQAAAALDAARRAVGEAEARLTYGEVHAPFAGVVTDRRVEVGDLASPGQPLVTVERTDSVKVTVIVAESAAADIDVGAAARIVAAGRRWQGRIESIVATANPRSRTYEVRLVVPNEDGSLRSGQFARAGFILGRRQTLLVDRDLVVRQGQLQGVYVLSQGRALLRWLRLGSTHGDDVEVLSGLDAGETLVHPVAGVRDGVAIARGRDAGGA